jgi:putative acetyltransferase
MISIHRDNSNNNDFRDLVSLLDSELNNRYGKLQEEYDDYNHFEFLDTVVIVYYNNIAVGCGCFKVFDEKTIEIKRMYVEPEMRGKGISKLILNELEQWAIKLGYDKAVLETGINQPEAINLYGKSGYVRTPNYSPYVNMPNSICMKKNIVLTNEYFKND